MVKERFEVTVVATPTMPPMPQTFLEISGEGDAITDNLQEWGACEKAVFTWDAPARVISSSIYGSRTPTVPC